MYVGVYVPVGGKKLLTYLDDLNMPAKDEYGSQPPLELVRQWIDYGFWYDRLKQTIKEIRVRGTHRAVFTKTDLTIVSSPSNLTNLTPKIGFF